MRGKEAEATSAKEEGEGRKVRSFVSFWRSLPPSVAVPSSKRLTHRPCFLRKKQIEKRIFGGMESSDFIILFISIYFYLGK